MSATYLAISWNRQKRIYDAFLAAAIAGTLALFIGATLWRDPGATAETLMIRGTALTALFLLHVILAIGPLARLEPRFLPLLYNRRHLGVALFVLALVHGLFSVIQFHALGNENPLVSLFTAYARDYKLADNGSIAWAHFPFEPFGVVALLILFLMAATSHDFWLKNLGAGFWKLLHLLVYVAYGSVLIHVALGALQYEKSLAYPILLGLGFLVIITLHGLAALREYRVDQQIIQANAEGYVAAGAASDLQESFGRTVRIGSERIALFRHQDRIYATSNVCRHQGGPLGEGRVLDGCITCPWHGWQYRPEDGCSPPPFQEIIPTHAVRIIESTVYVRAEPNPPATHCAGVAVPTTTSGAHAAGDPTQ